MKKKKRVLMVALPVLILLAGAGILRMMTHGARPRLRSERGERAVPVRVMRAHKEDRRVRVQATGSVFPRREVGVTAEVGGKIVYVAPAFVAGGFFSRGERMAAIEDTDYRLAVERAEALVAKKEYEVTATEARARVAEAEWRRLHPDGGQPDNPLVLYGPQLKDAKANLKSARAALEQARVNLARTVIRAPFNCRVRSEQVGVGQYVKAGNVIGTVGGTDEAEIVVPVAVADLRWLTIPKKAGGRGSEAEVSVTVGGTTHRWSGWIERALGDVDPVGKMARVAVIVQDPCNLAREGGHRPDLAFGMFVDVTFTGAMLHDVFPLPRRALRPDDIVWLVGPESRLRKVPVTVAYADRTEEFISQGLAEGDTVVLTRISGAVEGTLLRIMSQGAASP